MQAFDLGLILPGCFLMICRQGFAKSNPIAGADRHDSQRIYADTFKIFYDPCGGDRFGMVWDPSVKQSRPFRVLGGFSSEPVHKVR